MSFESWNLNQKLQGVWDAILTKCERVKLQAGYWMCHCPAHGEQTPSLEVKPSPDGEKVLLKCQAGCETETVLRALGLEWGQLFATPKPARDAVDDQDEDTPTIKALATARKLPVQLLEQLGCKDVPNGVLIPYRDEHGNEVAFRIRTRISGKPKYVSKAGGKVAVYGADRLPAVDDRDGKQLVLVEGETDCWTLWHHGVTALGISSSTHTKSLLKRHVQGFATVYVVQEPDAAGEKFVNGVADRLYDHGFTGDVRVIRPTADVKDPGGLHVLDPVAFPGKWSQWVEAAGPLNVRDAVIRAAGGEKERADKPPKPDQTADLFTLGKEHAEVVLDEDSNIPIARIDLDGERVDCPVRSGNFTQWLTRLYLSKVNKPVIRSNLDNAVANIAAAYSRKVKTFTRIARVGGTVYYDLCSGGKVVEVTAAGWRVLDKSPVFFVRGQDAAPQVEPARGGKVADLLRVANVSRDEFPLLVAFLLDALKGAKPFLFGSIHGGPGSAKTWMLRIIKSLVDPSRSGNGLPIPGTVLDLYVTAKHRYLLDFDNVSRIPAPLSDALCRLSTGSGAAVRTLYTNSDETVFNGANPILFNGIPDFVEKPDLQDRTISLTLPKIAEGQRRADEELHGEFGALKPGILGALLDMMANGLRHLDGMPTTGGPRMMSSYRWLRACETGTGLPLAECYRNHTDDVLADHARNDPLTQALVAALTAYHGSNPGTGHVWTGPATELYDLMKPHWLTDTRKEENQVPGNGQVLSNRLMMLAEPLSRVGIDVTKGRTGKRGRFLTVDGTRHFAPQPAAGDEKERADADAGAGEVLTAARPVVKQLKLETTVTCSVLPQTVRCKVATWNPWTRRHTLRFMLTDEEYKSLPEPTRAALFRPAGSPGTAEWRLEVDPADLTVLGVKDRAAG